MTSTPNVPEQGGPAGIPDREPPPPPAPPEPVRPERREWDERSEPPEAPVATATSGTPAARSTLATPDGPGTRGGRVSTGPLRLLAVLVALSGVVLCAAGAITWVVVTAQLSDEEIVVSDDADNFAGEDVDGPFTAYAQADVINTHALAETDGQTYAELAQDDPRRDTVMTASFLRASLFTSVVSFGVAAFAFGIGVLMILIGWALLRVDKALRSALRPGL
jgi:hypothetical protein